MEASLTENGGGQQTPHIKSQRVNRMFREISCVELDLDMGLPLRPFIVRMWNGQLRHVYATHVMCVVECIDKKEIYQVYQLKWSSR